MKRLLIYGANGYTGRLIARTAHMYDITPVLAGRDEASVSAVAASTGFETRTFNLEDAPQHLDDIAVVLHCAGPFSRTWEPMVRACIDRGVHYLDITGEIGVFESIASLDDRAKAADVMLLPGTGFDVVPTDCLAAHVAQRLPDATHLFIGISGSGRLSRGTMTTALEKTGKGGQVRRNGRIVSVPAAWRTRHIDFGDGEKSCVTIPWGDVSTAFYSTGIPDIEVYAAVPEVTQKAMRASRWVGGLLQFGPVKRTIQERIMKGPAGPSERELNHGVSRLWARAENDAGGVAESVMTGPNGYMMTAHTALLAAQRVLTGHARPGFQTPSRAFGENFALEVPGMVRTDRM